MLWLRHTGGLKMLSRRSLSDDDDYPTDWWSLFRHSWVQHLTGAFIALFIVGPILYLALDREPPWVRLRGEVIEEVHAGGTLQIKWYTTPLQRVCPGTLQVEIISGRLIWPVLQRPVGANKLGTTEYTPAPWPVFSDIPPGPAIYRVSSFWYCNWLQELTGWSIVQVGPEIPFIVLPEVVNK